VAIMGFVDTIKNFNVNPDAVTMTGILAHPIVGKIWLFTKIGFSIVLVGLGLYLMYKFWFEYTVRLTIYKKIGVGGIEVVHDLGKIVTDVQNKTKIVLLRTKKGKEKVTCPIPAAEYRGKKGKFDHYTMFLDDNMEVHPIAHPVTTGEIDRLEIRPQERAAWGRMEDEIIFKKFQKKDKLLQYATPAILMAACFSAFLIFFFASKEVGSGLQQLAVTFQQIASSCTRMG